MAYAYLLSDYHEHGSENVVGTLDRSILPALLERKWPDSRQAQKNLALLLEKPDEELARPDPWNCDSGWGGIQLHVIALIEA